MRLGGTAWRRLSARHLREHFRTNVGALVGALIAVSSGSGLAAEGQVVFRGIPHDVLYDVDFEGQHGISVGDAGLIVDSVDAGATWTRQSNTATDLGLFCVVRKLGKCIAGGQGGLILFSDDCKSWTQVSQVSKARILSVSANGKGVAVAVGGFGAILRSADWGKSWQAVDVDWKDISNDGAEPHLYDVHVADNGEVTVVGEFELILRSRNSGATWTVAHRGTRSLFSLKVLDSGEAYAVGQEGVILKTERPGKGWQELESGTRSILTSVWAGKWGRVLAAGIYTVLWSDDSGRSWQQDASKLAKALSYQAVIGVDKGDGSEAAILVGSGGAIVSAVLR